MKKKIGRPTIRENQKHRSISVSLSPKSVIWIKKKARQERLTISEVVKLYLPKKING